MSASITPFFTPTSITGCSLWLDGADTSSSSFTYSSGSNISVWKDKSSSANNFSLTSGTTSSINDGGNIVVNFPSGAIMTSASQITFTTSSAFFLVSKVIDTTYFSYVLGFSDIFSGDLAFKYLYGILTGTPASSQSSGTGELGSTTTYVNGNYNPNFGSNYYTNVYAVIDTVAPVRSGTSYLTLSSSFYGRYFVGRIAEFIYYAGGVTSTQRTTIEAYLAQKWGLTASLPSGHTGLTTTFYRSPIVTPIKITPYSSVSYAFAPTQITGCQLWLDAQDNSTISLTSGYVSAVTDKALGTSFTSTGSTPANLTVASASINSFQSFYFNNAAGNYVGLHGNLAQLTTGTAIFVMKYLSTQNGAWRPIFGWNDNGSTQSIAYGTNLNGGGTAGPYVENIGYNGSATATLTNNGLYIVTFTFTGTTTGVGYNGQISLTAGTVPSYSGSGTSIGICTEASGTQNTNVYLGEIIIYNTVLGSTDRQKVESYLAQKWGLTSSLAATHPGLTTTYYLTQSILSRAAITTPAISAKIPINLSGLIIYYPFDNSLNDFYTLTSLSITGSYSYTTGKKNQCLSLTNTSGVAPTNYLSSSYVLPSTFTVSLWFQTPNTSVGSMVFCAASNISLVNGSISIYFSGGYLGCAYSDIANNGLAYAISANTWYHAAITYNSGSMLLYVNGSLSGNTVTGTNSKSGFTLGGGRDSGTQYPFTGYIDDFRIYNRILTTTELTAIYNNLG
jgi:hypothetical protein